MKSMVIIFIVKKKNKYFLALWHNTTNLEKKNCDVLSCIYYKCWFVVVEMFSEY